MLDRRHFIKQFGIFSIAFSGFGRALANTSTINHLLDQDYNKGYGPLIKDPNGILDLPKGFTYNIISQYEDSMDDGLYVPNAADGMTCFKGKGNNVILIRNHELGHSPNLGKLFNDHNPFGKNFSK